jgi:hypothetical protein
MQWKKEMKWVGEQTHQRDNIVINIFIFSSGRFGIPMFWVMYGIYFHFHSFH